MNAISIPMSNVFLTTIVANSPYTIVVNSASTKSVWGNGFRTGTEAWDDGNIVSGDGCSSTWTVEIGYKCTGGSISSKDICSLIYEVSFQENLAILLTFIIFNAGAFVNIVTSLLTTSSPVSIFSMFNQFQILYLLLVTGTYVSNGVFNLITGMSFTLFSFSFIEINKINIF